jgi:FkbM family methyltransferase
MDCASDSRVADALAAVGEDAEARTQIIAALKQYERRPEHRFTTVRDDVTGPIADTLHASVGTLRKHLSNGLVIEFLYRSKIARDFVMASAEMPDHVWEPQTTKLLLHLCADARDVIVGGAYFGDQAIPMANAMRGTGTCHAFEPAPEQATMLAHNAALNFLDNLRVNPIALWGEAGAHLAFVGEDALASTVVSEEGMPTTTIDAYVAEQQIEQVGLVMVDLEGSELGVLRGAERVLQRDRPHLVFEIHRLYVDWSNGLENTDIVKYVASFGYTILAVRDFQSNVDLGDRPIELVPLESVFLAGPPHGFNVVAVADPTVLEGERFQVVPNVSPKLLFHRDPARHHPLGGL